MPDTSGSVTLGQSPEAPQPEMPQVVAAKTAFLVIEMPDGSVTVSPQLDINVMVERPPTIDDVFRASATVVRDVQVEQTAMKAAQHVVNAQMQLGRQIAEAQQNQQILSQMQNVPVPGQRR